MSAVATTPSHGQQPQVQAFQPRSTKSILGEAAKKAAIVAGTTALAGACGVGAGVAITAATGGTGAEIGAVALVGGLGVVAATPVVFAISFIFFVIMLKAQDLQAAEAHKPKAPLNHWLNPVYIRGPDGTLTLQAPGETGNFRRVIS